MLIIINKKETYKVLGEDITIDAKVLYNKHTKEEVFNEELDSKNLELAYNTYKKNHNLMRDTELKRKRVELNLSIKELANLTGYSERQILRYELGSIQPKDYDDKLNSLYKASK